MKRFLAGVAVGAFLFAPAMAPLAVWLHERNLVRGR